MKLLRTGERPGPVALRSLIKFIKNEISEMEAGGIAPDEAVAPLGKFLFRLGLTEYSAICFLAACEEGRRRGKTEESWFIEAQENLCVASEKHIVSAYGFMLLNNKVCVCVCVCVSPGSN